MSPHTCRGVVLSERSESKDDGSGAPGSLDVARDSFDRRGTLSEVEGLPGGLHFARDAVPSGIEGRQKPPLTVEGASLPIQMARWDEALAASRQVDINTANAAELERLPEIGPGLAKRIVEYRRLHGRFTTPQDLLHVRGIGPKKLKTLEAFIVVR